MGAESCVLLQEVVGQIADCLKSGGEQEGTPSNRWLHDLITAYVSATPTCKTSQRTPLSSPNNDSCCCMPAESNGAPLRRVQPARLQDLPEPAAAGADWPQRDHRLLEASNGGFHCSWAAGCVDLGVGANH